MKGNSNLLSACRNQPHHTHFRETAAKTTVLNPLMQGRFLRSLQNLIIILHISRAPTKESTPKAQNHRAKQEDSGLSIYWRVTHLPSFCTADNIEEKTLFLFWICVIKKTNLSP